jgi:hypothetical protein
MIKNLAKKKKFEVDEALDLLDLEDEMDYEEDEDMEDDEMDMDNMEDDFESQEDLANQFIAEIKSDKPDAMTLVSILESLIGTLV